MLKNLQKIEQIAGLTLICAIVVGCWFVLRPFISAILWAAILCFATWPLYQILLKWLRGKRNLAAGIMTILILIVIFLPFFIVGLKFTDIIKSAMEWINLNKESTLPPPPAWVANIPLLGTKIADYWAKLADSAEPAVNWLKPWFHQAGLWALQHSLDFARGVLQIALSIFIAFFLYRDGVEIAASIQEGFRRISGDYAQHMLNIVKSTVQSVVYGLIGTALVQSVAAGIGFLIAGVPSPILLAMFTFFMSFIPAGPMLIWGAAAVWLFSTQHIGMGIFMVAYGILVISSVDNFVRPYLISRGSKLPFIVMLIGILGGIAAFGVIGVFLGPTLLAIGYSLTNDILIQRKKNAESKLTDNKPKDRPPQQNAQAKPNS